MGEVDKEKLTHFALSLKPVALTAIEHKGLSKLKLVPSYKHPEGFECKQCGKCCFAYLDAYCCSISEEEYQRFIEAGRQDIVDRIVTFGFDGKDGYVIHDVWFSPITGEEATRCPFVRKLPNKDKYKCMIHDLKIDKCRDYPKIGQKDYAIKIGCKGWEK